MKALVLSGGGAKGAYQVGALKRWMGEQKKEYDAICGISVGAINGAFLAQFAKGEPTVAAQQLEDLWKRVDNSKIKRSWCPFGRLSALWKPSVYDSAPLQSWIRRELDVEKIKQFKRPLRIVAVSWDTGEAKVVDESAKELQDWVIASSAFPIMLSPIQIGTDLWTDGGLRSVTPLGEAIKLGATEVDVIMCSDPFAKSSFQSGGKAAIPGLLLRALDVQSDQIMRADLEICGLKNDLAPVDKRWRAIKLRLLQPSKPLEGDSLDFDPALTTSRMKQGYEDAARAMEAAEFADVKAFTKPDHDRRPRAPRDAKAAETVN